MFLFIYCQRSKIYVYAIIVSNSTRRKNVCSINIDIYVFLLSFKR